MNKHSEYTSLTLKDLLIDWEDYSNTSSIDPDICLAYGVQALKLGHFSISYNILRQGLIQHPGHTDLKSCAALALARGCSISTATDILRDV